MPPEMAATSSFRADRHPLVGFSGLELLMAGTTPASAWQFSDQGTPMAIKITSGMVAASHRTNESSFIDVMTRNLVTPTKTPCSGLENW